jgi:hypothetical protein
MDGNGVGVGFGFSPDAVPPAFDTTSPHWLHLHCDVAATKPEGYPNYLKITWTDPQDNLYVFMLRKVLESSCTPARTPIEICGAFATPDCFDTIDGSGEGDLTTYGPPGPLPDGPRKPISLPGFPACVGCAQVTFHFQDNDGAVPAPPDFGTFTVSRVIGSDWAAVDYGCTACGGYGNYTTHQRNGACFGPKS